MARDCTPFIIERIRGALKRSSCPERRLMLHLQSGKDSVIAKVNLNHVCEPGWQVRVKLYAFLPLIRPITLVYPDFTRIQTVQLESWSTVPVSSY